MADYRGSYYSENFSFKDISSFSSESVESGTCYYEVMRVMNGICLFIEDHLNRLRNSVTLAGLDFTFTSGKILSIVKELIRRNGLANGNIRLVLRTAENQPSILYSYLVPFSYPDLESYEQGVPAAVFKFVRTHPNIKQYKPDYQKQLQAFIRKSGVYEALLLDDSDCITEGSKSNVFFIRNECVFTAPGIDVLKGITREKVISLCNKLNYKIIECPVSIDTLTSMEAAFITGTSPKLLPLNRIDQVSYSTGNVMMRNLMAAYDQLILEDIERWR
jgi:branched-chain amino acid aminotransferase